MDSRDSLKIKELILSVREGEDEAFGELVTLYTPMIRGVISRYGVAYDEYFSDACMALYKAAHTYDVEQEEVTFGLYSRICVSHRILDIIRSESGRAIHLSEEDLDSLSVDPGIIAGLVREEETRAFRKRARQLLSDFEFSVFNLWLSELKSAGIAQRLGKSVKAIDNAKARILKKLRDGLNSAQD